MTTLICFGLGYSADHYLGQFGDRFERIVGTVRSAERAALLNARFGGRLRAFAFDGAAATPEVSTRHRARGRRAGVYSANANRRSGADGLR